MTTVSTPASSNGRARIRPVRWRRLAWVSWRQYRLSAVGTAAFLGVLAPLSTRANGAAPSSSWTISQWWTGPNGQRVTNINKIIQLIQGPHRGYSQWTIYQPASRYWAFQFIEGGWVLALSLLLIAATIWLVRRRAA